VGKECTADQVDVIFDKWSVELRLRGYRGQNYIFSVKKLFAEIVTADSKYLLKNNSLTLVLVKRENKSWTQIAYKEDKLGKPEKEEKAEDPSAGIMNMMKKMYEDGDENMKRTIAEAWTKANDKKAQGEQPDFKDRYDFLNKK
jgi:calcyclin binding protein